MNDDDHEGDMVGPGCLPMLVVGVAGFVLLVLAEGRIWPPLDSDIEGQYETLHTWIIFLALGGVATGAVALGSWLNRRDQDRAGLSKKNAMGACSTCGFPNTDERGICKRCGASMGDAAPEDTLGGGA